MSMQSGVSWLHDTLLERLNERRETLKEGIARGVESIKEYRQLVGRCEELRRLINMDIPELFEDFYQADADDDEEDDGNE